jgi:mono/diheme cytochrome c family protein
MRFCASSVLGLATALAACRTEQTLVAPDPHLQRMLKQEKVVEYDEEPLLPRAMAMQKPPDGTIPADAIAGQPLVVSGVADDRWAGRIPIRLDRSQVEIGRQRFDTFCAACHGVLGDGASVVAEKMTLRKPPSLHEARTRGYPPGRIYHTVRHGYGLMPSYAVQLSVQETWAVVAYVRALQIARAARASDLPPDVRAELAKEAP